MKYEKPPLTFEQQVQLLIDRGMIGDPDVIRSKLSTVNYYRLSAYWYTFRVQGTEKLRDGTKFDHVWDRYVFDQRLRMLVMEAIERIEVAARTQLAYHHSHAFGAFAYAATPSSLPRMTQGPISDRESHAYFIEDVRKQIRRSRDQLFVKHFTSKYTSSPDLPIWMATELMSLGNVLRMFQGCREQEREPVASIFGVSISIFESWLLALLNVRNVCAHHGRLWNRKLAKVPKLPSSSAWRSPVMVDPTTMFAALCICAWCLDRVSPGSNWCKRVRALVDDYPSIPKGRTVRNWTMGLADNWLECPLWSGAR